MLFRFHRPFFKLSYSFDYRKMLLVFQYFLIHVYQTCHVWDDTESLGFEILQWQLCFKGRLLGWKWEGLSLGEGSDLAVSFTVSDLVSWYHCSGHLEHGSSTEKEVAWIPTIRIGEQHWSSCLATSLSGMWEESVSLVAWKGCSLKWNLVFTL